jgi:hypothetical protein
LQAQIEGGATQSGRSTGIDPIAMDMATGKPNTVGMLIWRSMG